MKQLPLVLALSACTYDAGGPVLDREAQVSRLAATGEVVRITGYCASSCTMQLGLPNVCVTDTAVLVFHPPTRGADRLHGPELAYWVDRIAQTYPAPLAAWYQATDGVTVLRVDDAVRMGVNRC